MNRKGIEYSLVQIEARCLAVAVSDRRSGHDR